MFNLSENYRLRQSFLQTDTVPTMTMMKKKMTEKLAAVYFQSMTPKLKVIAGLEPSLKGGGGDWYVPPKDLLEGRTVLRPTSKELLSKLSHKGIDILGMQLFKKHRKTLDIEKEQVLQDCDFNHREDVQLTSAGVREKTTEEGQKKNTEYMINAFKYFTYLYRESLGKINILFEEAAIAEIKRTRENAIRHMKKHYADALKAQATQLYNQYAQKLEDEKNRLKNKFIHKLEERRTEMGDKLHDLKVDKHLAVENLRRFLDCRNLACQVYVALKEREACEKEIEESKHKHWKKVKALTEEKQLKDLEIYLATKKDKRRKELITIWQKKICHVIKKFQIFVSYCLSTLPEHAEFFINMEKLMMIQLSQVLEQPSAESIIEIEEEHFHTPVPKPRPFYLFCDKGYKPSLDEKLCPKRTSSSASQLPVIVINKRCLYAACDNFEEFGTKIKQYIHGTRGDDADFEDDNIYSHVVPVKYTSSRQLLDLTLESSLLQVLQEEIPNLKQLPLKIDHYETSCLCTPCATSHNVSDKTRQASPLQTISSKDSVKKFVYATRDIELVHERQPKWDSYFDFIESKKCMCTKKGKKHMSANLPAYMQQRSKYDQPELLQYEMCSVSTLKKLVREARTQSTPSTVESVPSKTRDVSTQCEDVILEQMCTCFSDAEIGKLLSSLTLDPAGQVSPISSDEFKIVGSSTTSAYLDKHQSSFATERIRSLRNIVEDLPDLKEIFARKDC